MTRASLPLPSTPRTEGFRPVGSSLDAIVKSLRKPVNLAPPQAPKAERVR